MEVTTDKDQIVYVLINEAMPGYTKIGRTSNLEIRIKSLDTTSVPLPFECVYAAKVNDANFVERKLHDAFGDNRTRSSREFFEIDPERVVAALQLATIEDVTPKQDYVETEEDQKALSKARERRGAFNFKMVSIPVGSILTFTRDDEITCTVIDSKNVEFEGEIMSTSQAGKIALHRKGWTASSVQGPLYWEFEGETLQERRLRMEEED